jgi:hypothetical protein
MAAHTDGLHNTEFTETVQRPQDVLARHASSLPYLRGAEFAPVPEHFPKQAYIRLRGEDRAEWEA